MVDVVEIFTLFSSFVYAFAWLKQLQSVSRHSFLFSISTALS